MQILSANSSIPASGRGTRAVVDLNAIRSNVAGMRDKLADGVQLAAVVKADAYGHGSVAVSKAALEAGASVLAVAMAEEAIPLREAGIDSPILVIGPSNRAQMSIGVHLGLDLCAFDPAAIRQMQEEADIQETIARVHLKIDSGMGRIGTRSAEDLEEVLRELQASPNVEVAGVFTHLARADEYKDDAPSIRQLEIFQQSVDKVRSFGYSPLVHASNSAAAQNLPGLDFDMVRFGISMYGYAAGEGSAARNVALTPAMRVEAEISAVRDVPAGTSIGYGGTYRTERPSRIATVQIGYGDGYNRLLSNRGKMIVRSGGHARFAPVAGRVCMDMTMLDVTDLLDVRPGDTAIAMGSTDGLHWDAADIAGMCGTISYEVLCGYGTRIPRVYENVRPASA